MLTASASGSSHWQWCETMGTYLGGHPVRAIARRFRAEWVGEGCWADKRGQREIEFGISGARALDLAAARRDALAMVVA
jgi:hypothetical protein